DGGGNQTRLAHLRELHEPRAVPEAALQVGGGADGEAGLTDAAWADQAQEPRRRQLLSDLGQLVTPADEARRFGWQVAKPPAGSGHRQPKLLPPGLRHIADTESAISPITFGIEVPRLG